MGRPVPGMWGLVWDLHLLERMASVPQSLRRDYFRTFARRSEVVPYQWNQGKMPRSLYGFPRRMRASDMAAVRQSHLRVAAYSLTAR